MRSFNTFKHTDLMFCAMLLCGIGSAASELEFDQSVLDKVEQTYGATARQRLLAWQKLINNASGASDLEKLRQVNDFFNQNAVFVDDFTLWHKEDYWATPSEFLAKGAGDCEDYSIAKYFSLVEMGVDESKLRITYVKALELNQAHMVLTYYESPQASPLILDNLQPSIKPATQRNDLVPVYSFNGSSLWLAKNKGSGQIVSDADRLSLWRDLKQRVLDMPF